jgi:hypothetical protein
MPRVSPCVDDTSRMDIQLLRDLLDAEFASRELNDSTFRLHGPAHLRCIQACTYSLRPPPLPPEPPPFRALNPIWRASSLQCSNFAPAPGWFRLTQSNRIGPGGYSLQFWALAFDAVATRAIVVIIVRNSIFTSGLSSCGLRRTSCHLQMRGRDMAGNAGDIDSGPAKAFRLAGRQLRRQG